MNIVYVLVSDDSDIYYEECMISILSLRKYNSETLITVVTDDVTNSGFYGKRAEIKKYARIVCVEFEESIDKRRRSRELKSSLRKIIEGPFLYIDTDTVICDKLELNDFSSISIGMVLDKHIPITRYFNRKFYFENAERLGFSVGYKGNHFNSGVMWVNDNYEATQFFDKWRELYSFSAKHNIYIDQVSMNETNQRMEGIITELPGEWNVQVDSGLNYLYKAKIIHYAGFTPNHINEDIRISVPYSLCDYKLFMEYKEDGTLPLSIKNIINNPKGSFKNTYIIADDCAAYDILGSNHFKLIRYLMVRSKSLFSLFEVLYGKLFGFFLKR